MGYINEKINQLEREIKILKDRVNSVESDTPESNDPTPYTVVGGNKDVSSNFPVDLRTGLGGTYGSFMPWNDAELKFPSYGTKPDTPTEGYHRHGHSEFAGGALDINTLQLVEYDVDFNTSGTYNKHCQQFWKSDPPIAKSNGGVAKIGLLDIEFDEVSGKWLTGANYIDVERTYLVKKNSEGEIELDDKENQKKAPLYNADVTKTNVVWDEVGLVWRFYAVYAEEPENQPDEE